MNKPEDKTAAGSLIHFLKDKGKIVLGRATHTDVVNDHPTVSKEHASIEEVNGEYFVTDLNSSHGTFINGKKVKGRVKFTDKDTLYVGMNAYKLNEQVRDLTKEHAINAVGVEKVYPNGLVGLQKMSVSIASGEFVALMGPSGCGKSTLLKTLNYDNPATAGNVKIYGHDIRTHYEMLKRKIGYVPQDDIVHNELTVQSSLYYAAKLRLADDTPETEIEQRITEVLESLNINDPKVRANKVGELSGGQRKRISIAVELLNKPSILFLDEPTSPLDPETVEEFLKCLKRLNATGTTIVMVTHKPEDLHFVDKVIFMAAKGYHVFYGETKDFLPHFSKERIIEVYSYLRDTDRAKQEYEKWYGELPKDSSEELEQELAREKHESPIRQYYWLSKRYLNIKLNDRYNLALLMAQPFIIAGLIGFIFDYFSIGVLFLMAISAIWFGVSNAAKEIVSEVPIYKRERMFNMGIMTYLLSKITVLSLIALVQVIVFVGIIYLRFARSHVGLGGFFDSASFMFYLSLSATLLGLLLSSIFDTTEKVMTVVPIALMPQIMLAGVVTRIDSVLKEILSYFTLGRWGTQGFASIQDRHYAITDSTGSVMQQIPHTVMHTDTIPGAVTIITAVPKVVGDTLSSAGAMHTLAFYEAGNKHHLLQLFQTIPQNLMVITALNLLIFAGLYWMLKRKDTM